MTKDTSGTIRGGTWAVVPVKELTRAKSRLADRLTPAERVSLCLDMIRDVLAVLNRVRGLAGTVVVTRDPRVIEIARQHGACPVPDGTEEGVSQALAAGVRAVAGWGGDRILFVPGDVPLLTTAGVERLLSADAATVCIVPAIRDGGTNALLCNAHEPIEFAFGPGSCERHQEAATRRGLAVQLLHDATLGMDIDIAADLDQLAQLEPDRATAQWFANTVGSVRPGASSELSALAMTARLSREQARIIGMEVALPDLMAAAAAVRDAGHEALITYSRKVFIPLTRLCRDVCHYCTFATTPRHLESAYLSPDEVLAIARQGKAAGCQEALFTLGDRPETRYREAREALERLGFASTVDYIAAIAKRVVAETGLLPHINAGVLSEAEYLQLRSVAPSMGMMLESSATRLFERGGPHFGSPDKDPAVRIASLEAAGRARIPFTSGILIGIGETREERLDSLFVLRDLHERHGHLQEVIVQNFCPKPDTKMHGAPAAASADMLWTVAMARLILGPYMSLQAPPNLNIDSMAALIDAGINDWGGVSPVTPDHVNPELPWPEIERLRAATAARGKFLAERLTVYPPYIAKRDSWIDTALHGPVLRHADSEGLARVDGWQSGVSVVVPRTVGARVPGSAARRGTPRFERILARAVAGDELAEGEVVRLFGARGDEHLAVAAAADELRRQLCGDTVTYVVNRNINYTNLCTYHCTFCAFSKGKGAASLRGPGYLVELEEIERRVAEAGARGATEVCLQGGIHPTFTGDTYLSIARASKQADPGIHVHAFSPLEVRHGADTLGLTIAQFLERLQRAGLATLPGTAAEILDDEVRRHLCPDKLSTQEWLDIVETAHRVGLRTTATIMYGHLETPLSWARHLLAIRRLQARTGGFTEFVPLPFVADEAPLYRKGRARPGPTWREALLMHAVSRLTLQPLVRSIQASWVKLGPEGAAACLQAGVNDLGGTLMNESISRAAGAAHGQEFAPEQMEALAAGLGRKARQRTTLYGIPDAARQQRSYGAAALAETVTGSARAPKRRPPPPAFVGQWNGLVC